MDEKNITRTKFLELLEKCKLNYVEQILFMGLWSFYYLEIATVRQEILLKEHIDGIANDLAKHVQKRRRKAESPEGDHSEILIETKYLAEEYIESPDGKAGKEQELMRNNMQIKANKLHNAIIEEIKYQLKIAEHEISQYYEDDYIEHVSPIEINFISNLINEYNKLPVEKGFLQYNMGIKLLNLFEQIDIKRQHKAIAELVRKLETPTTQ